MKCIFVNRGMDHHYPLQDQRFLLQDLWVSQDHQLHGIHLMMVSQLIILQVGNPAHNIQLFLFLLIFKFSLEIYEMCSNSMRLFDRSKKAPSFTRRSKPVGQVLGWSRLPYRWNTTTSKQCI